MKRVHIVGLCIALAVFLQSGTVFAEQLVIPGTGACEFILKELAAVFNAQYPGSEVIIPPSVHSSGGIRLVGTDEYELGRVARSVNDSEMHYNLQQVRFARDAIVFAVGTNTGISGLRSRELADIFSGKIRNWQEVGGNDAPVRVLIREPQDTALQILRQQIEPFRDIEFSGQAKTLFHDYEVAEAFNKYTTVIGWLSNSTLLKVNPSVKAIAIDDIAPTQENVYDGKYSLTLDYSFVYKEGHLSGLAKKFMGFVFSQEGSKILVNAGLVPAKQQ